MRKSIWFVLLGLMALVGGANPALAQTDTKVNLLLSADQARPGETVWAGVHIDLAGKWHTYWRYGGEAASPPQIDWTLPEGVQAGEIQWPLPEKYELAGSFSYVYHDEVVLLVPLSLPATPGAVEIKASVRWLECEEVCVPQQTNVAASMVVGDASVRSAQAERIDAWRAKVPPVDPSLQVGMKWDGEGTEDERSFVAWVRDAEQGQLVDFYPHAFDDFEVTGDTEAVTVANDEKGIRKGVFKYDGAWPQEIAGLVVVQRPGETEPLIRETTLRIGDAVAGGETSAGAAPGQAVGEGTSAAAGPGTLQMLLFAFIGGLILNFMPCVLPVIALKILGFVKQSQEAPGMVRRLGVVYAMGVLASFLVLAGLVVAVQQAGRLASWGMQFQSLGFLIPMMVLVTLVSLNFFGVFEISLGGGTMGVASRLSGRDGYLGAFFNGVLATILATPCTAPFLATALGFAFAQPPGWIVLFFVTIAAGLAFPYVLLSWNPTLMKFLPKPGPWMGRFKTAMGFPMLATAVWLYSVALSHFSAGAELWLGLLLVVVGLAAWIWGQFVQQVAARKPLSIGVALLIGVGGGAWILERELEWRKPVTLEAAGDGKIISKGIEWLAWSHAAVTEAREAGHPVLVDFTAKWCQNCQVNKRISIEIDSVREKLKAIDGVTFRADFTHYDPVIAKELEHYERAGVPLVLVFSPDAERPADVLPALLTPQIVLDALDRAAAPGPVALK